MPTRKSTRTTADDQDLLKQLGVGTTPAIELTYTAKEQRIIAGFEEIEQFYIKYQRIPQHGEQNSIFERLYAVRLDQIRSSKECRELLLDLDHHKLLEPSSTITPQDLDDFSLLEALLGRNDLQDDLTLLKHVRTNKQKQIENETAQRIVCKEFDIYTPLFNLIQSELKSGKRKTIRCEKNGEILVGDLFILEGQITYVAEMGEKFIHSYGDVDARLRVIYDNGTESNLLLRTLQKNIYKNDTSRKITATDLGPLFANDINADDVESGTIYILRSLSEQPLIAKNRNIIHKIGLTKNELKKRLANAKKEPTYLLSEVAVVHTIKLANINRQKFESLLHQFFSKARLDLVIKDRFDQDIRPKEWFLIPLPAILTAIDKIMDGSLIDYHYDTNTASVKELS